MLHRKSSMSETFSKLAKKAKPASDFLQDKKLIAGEIIKDFSHVVANTEIAQSVANSESYKTLASFWEPESKRVEERLKQLEERRQQLQEREDRIYDLMEKGQLLRPLVRYRSTTG